MSRVTSCKLDILIDDLDDFMKSVNEFKNQNHHKLIKIGGLDQFVEAQGQLRLSSARLKQLKIDFEGKEQSEFNQINPEDSK